MQQSVLSSIAELKRSPTVDANILKDYETLKTDIDAAIGSKGSLTPDALTTKVSDLNVRLVALTEKKNAALPAADSATNTPTTLLGATYSNTFFAIKGFMTILGSILGAIIGSHWFLQATVNNDFMSNRTLYKLFYALYGALLFPFTLMYAVINPPMWRAPLLPLYERGSEGEPAWVPGVFKYYPPSPDDSDTGKKILQILSGIVLATLTGTFFLFSSPNQYSLPSFLKA
jgi:hypothetical protein